MTLPDEPFEWTLDDIFDSGSWFGDQDSSSMRELREHLQGGRILQTTLEIPSAPANVRASFRGSFSHQTLCLHAVAWAVAQGHAFQEEAMYPGGRADLTCAEVRVAIECGNTKIAKVIRALEARWSVLVIPYGSETASGRILGAMFSLARDDALQEVVARKRRAMEAATEGYELPSFPKEER